MTLRFPFVHSADCARRRPCCIVAFILLALCAAPLCPAQDKTDPKQPAPAPDVLVLSNGDTLHGKFVSAIAGKVTFHSDPLGDITLSWDKIKELHTEDKFAVLSSKVKIKRRRAVGNLPVGTLEVTNQSLSLRPAGAAPPVSMPVKEAQYVMDEATLNKEVNHRPGAASGWVGAATAGATLVAATQNQYTFSGGISLVRTVPDVAWLDPRNRSSIDFTGSFGKITQPAYTVPATATTPAAVVASTSTKSAIYHADAERDEYFSSNLFTLAQTAFDHNYSQDLDLQQIYGGGLGWTVFKNPKQEADLKGTVQYEKQQFLSGATGTNQDLIGSTFSVNYLMKMKLFTYTQALSFIPAYNNSRAYSATETDTFAFPTYKSLSFSVGTLDSYLNDPPISLPPTKRNSFQFTMGLTYAIKSKY